MDTTGVQPDWNRSDESSQAALQLLAYMGMYQQEKQRAEAAEALLREWADRLAAGTSWRYMSDTAACMYCGETAPLGTRLRHKSDCLVKRTQAHLAGQESAPAAPTRNITLDELLADVGLTREELAEDEESEGK